MATLDYIDMIGVDTSTDEDNTEVKSNSSEEESNEDFVQDSEDAASDNTDKVTEPSELDGLREQIAGMEKRIADKDDFINELREKAKAQEAEENSDTKDVEVENVDFWDDPEGEFNAVKKQLQELKDSIAQDKSLITEQAIESSYANTVEGYHELVTTQSVRAAAILDPEFDKSMQNSKNIYKTAYEYLSGKEAEREAKYRAKTLKDLNIKEKREVPPSIGNGSSKNSDSDNGISGFAEFFGS